MANHIRQQIRERVGTTLTGLTTTGSNVFQSRVYNLEDSKLPAIIIYTKSEDSELLEMGSTRTLQRNFAEIIDQYKERGKASLRKKMYDKAVKKDNTMMQIFLSKNYLGMSDKVQQTNVTEPLPLIIEAEKVDG